MVSYALRAPAAVALPLATARPLRGRSTLYTYVCDAIIRIRRRAPRRKSLVRYRTCLQTLEPGRFITMGEAVDMPESPLEPLKLSMYVDGEHVEKPASDVGHILDALRSADTWHGASIHPSTGQFPRAHLSVHEPHGFVVQCWEDERCWSDFVTSGEPTSPAIEIEHGGQSMERWPRELFVPEDIVTEALQHFLDFGQQKLGLNWVRIDRFPREVVWEGRGGRLAWERGRSAI